MWMNGALAPTATNMYLGLLRSEGASEELVIYLPNVMADALYIFPLLLIIRLTGSAIFPISLRLSD